MPDYYLLLALLVFGGLFSLNTFNISIFTSMVAGIFGRGHGLTKLLAVAIYFMLAFATFYGLLSVLITKLIGLLPVRSIEFFGSFIGVAAVIFGLLAIKDFMWNRPFFAAPSKFHGILHKTSLKADNRQNALTLGVIAAATSVFSVSLQTVCFAILVNLVRPASPQWVLIPVVCLPLPLIAILIAIINRYRISVILKWRDHSKQMFHLCHGLAFISLAWLIWLIINRTTISTTLCSSNKTIISGFSTVSALLPQV